MFLLAVRSEIGIGNCAIIIYQFDSPSPVSDVTSKFGVGEGTGITIGCSEVRSSSEVSIFETDEGGTLEDSSRAVLTP